MAAIFVKKLCVMWNLSKLPWRQAFKISKRVYMLISRKQQKLLDPYKNQWFHWLHLSIFKVLLTGTCSHTYSLNVMKTFDNYIILPWLWGKLLIQSYTQWFIQIIKGGNMWFKHLYEWRKSLQGESNLLIIFYCKSRSQNCQDIMQFSILHSVYIIK